MKSFYLCTSVLRQVFQLECFMVIINTERRNKEVEKKEEEEGRCIGKHCARGGCERVTFKALT